MNPLDPYGNAAAEDACDTDALRTGNRPDWISTSADLREIAAWRAARHV